MIRIRSYTRYNDTLLDWSDTITFFYGDKKSNSLHTVVHVDKEDASDSAVFAELFPAQDYK